MNVYAESAFSSDGVSIDGNAHKEPTITRPPTGNRRHMSHHGLLSLSRSRRVPTASKGNKTISRNMLPKVSCTSVNAEAQITTNNTNHQSSEREARPSNSAYLVKHVRIDS